MRPTFRSSPGTWTRRRSARSSSGGGRVDAVGHRIVHGGSELVEPVVIDAAVLRQLHALVDLAPLHQPAALRALEVVSRLLPDVPQVGCFDTAFHASIPAAAATYALPLEWRTRWNLRRFGFHGLSHAYASTRAAELSGQPVDDLRIVTCHLGAGASLAAVAEGQVGRHHDGLHAARGAGDGDPVGLGRSRADALARSITPACRPAELEDALEHRSGLLGLTGSAEMEDVLAAEQSGDARAELGRRRLPAPPPRRHRRDGIGDGRARRAGLHRRRRRERPQHPRPRRRRSRVPGRRGRTRPEQRRDSSTPRSARRTRGCGSSRSGRGRTSRSREACAARSAAARANCRTVPDEHPRRDRGLRRVRARMGAHGGPTPAGPAGGPPRNDAQLQGRDDVAGVPGDRRCRCHDGRSGASGDRVSAGVPRRPRAVACRVSPRVPDPHTAVRRVPRLSFEAVAGGRRTRGSTAACTSGTERRTRPATRRGWSGCSRRSRTGEPRDTTSCRD